MQKLDPAVFNCSLGLEPGESDKDRLFNLDILFSVAESARVQVAPLKYEQNLGRGLDADKA